MINVSDITNNWIKQKSYNNEYNNETDDYSFIIFNASNEEGNGNKADDIDVMDHREEDGIWDKAKNYFKKIFKRPDFEVSQKDNVISVKRYYSYNLSTTTDFTFYDVNGELDEEIRQGQMEDCALISTCVSIASTEEGKDIIKDSISINYGDENKVESYNVYFKGLDETYTITQEELNEAIDSTIKVHTRQSKYSYSCGDKDMILFELAWTKCCTNSEKLKEYYNANKTVYSWVTNTEMPKGLSGTDASDLFYALTGDDLDTRSFTEIRTKKNKYFANSKKININDYLQNNNEFTLSSLCGVEEKDCDVNFKITDEDTEKIILAINSKDTFEVLVHPDQSEDNTITFKNKNTDEVYTVDYTEFLDTCSSFTTQSEKAEIAEAQYDKALEFEVVKLSIYDNINFDKVIQGKTFLSRNHAIAVKSINEDTITLIDPWNTSEEIIVEKEELLKFADSYSFSGGNIN